MEVLVYRACSYFVAVQDILNTYINFESAMTLPRVLVQLRYGLGRYGVAMPPVDCGIYAIAIWNRPPKLHLRAVDIGAAIYVVVAHPLKQVLQMALIRLKDTVQDCTLM
jgi:hypothetical protein